MNKANMLYSCFRLLLRRLNKGGGILYKWPEVELAKSQSAVTSGFGDDSFSKLARKN